MFEPATSRIEGGVEERGGGEGRMRGGMRGGGGCKSLAAPPPPEESSRCVCEIVRDRDLPVEGGGGGSQFLPEAPSVSLYRDARGVACQMHPFHSHLKCAHASFNHKSVCKFCVRAKSK